MSQHSLTMEQEVYTAFKKKGWNCYDAEMLERTGPCETIRHGPFSSLQIGGSYVLMPTAEDPTDYDCVSARFRELANKLNNAWPSIAIDGNPIELTGFTLRDDSVYIHCYDGDRPFPYSQFLGGLESIAETF